MLSQNQRKNYVDLKNTIVLEFAEAKTCTEIYIYPYIKIELPHILQNGFEMRLKVCLWKCSTRDYEEKSVNMIFYDKNRREA